MNNKQFRNLSNEAIKKANKLLGERGTEYNRPPVTLQDYFLGIDDPEKSAFDKIWTKLTRLRSHILTKRQGEETKRIEDVLDAINYLRFLYALIKKQEEGK